MTAGERNSATNESSETTRTPLSGTFRAKVLTFGIPLVAVFALAGAAALWASVKTGSLGAGIALLRGDSIYASVSGPVVLGESSPNGSTTVEFANLSDQPLRIVGYNSPCSCFTVAGLPTVLPPHARVTATISVGASRSAGGLPIVFLTDCPSQASISLRLSVQRPEPNDRQE